MPLYSDGGYFYSTGGSGLYSNPYSAPYYTTPSTYVGSSYGRPYAIPSLSSYSSSTSSRYQPKLSTINETPLGSRGLIPLTRLNSPKIITTPSGYHHHTSKYIPPRPININTADIDVSASRYRTRDLKSSPKSVPKSPTTQVNESPPIPQQTQQSSLSSTQVNESPPIATSPAITSPYMPRADGTDPAKDLNRSTIKRNRAVVRLSTVRSKSIRDRSIPRTAEKKENEKYEMKNNVRKRPKIDTSQSKKSEKLNEPVVNNVDTSTSWRDKFGDDLVPKPFGVIKKSPGELLLERHIIPSKYKDEVFVNSIELPAKKEIEKIDDVNTEIIIELDPLMQSAIRRLSIPKCPDFQDFCEDISSDKIDDDLNAGELRRRASIIQEQEIELLNQLQKSASGSFQLIHLERNESGSDLNGNRKSTKRKSLTKKPKKVRHKITATVDIQNSTLTPILQESLEEDVPVVVEIKKIKPKFTFNVDEIEENHTIHQVFKLPKKKSNEKSPKIEEENEEKVKKPITKNLEKIELKKGIKNSPKRMKVTKKVDPIKGVKSSPKKTNVEIEKVVKEENIMKLEEKTNQAKTTEQIENEISEIVTELKSIKPKEKIAETKLEENNSKTYDITEEQSFSKPETPKTPVMKKKPITPKPLEILKSKKNEEIKTKSPALTTKSPIKTSSPLTKSKSDISSQITPEHFKFDDESIKKTETQSPTILALKSAKFPISPLAIEHNKDESSALVARPKPIISKIQKSDSGEDFWNQIGSRETLYMSNRKRNVLESQWDKRETLLDNQSIDEIKNLDEIKLKVHDQKNEALKQADEQSPTGELGRRAHSNESALCTKKKGEHQDTDHNNKDKISENSNLEKSNEILFKTNNQNKISKEIPNKIPDINETLKKVNQPLQLPTPTDTLNTNTIKSSDEKQQDKTTTSNITKIEIGLKAKSPEIKSKEIDLNKNKLDPQKSAPEVATSVSTINIDVATKSTTTTTVATNNLPSSESKNKIDKRNDIKITENLQKSNDKISPKLITESFINNNNDKIVNQLSKNDSDSLLSLLNEENESKEKLSLSPAAIIIDNNNKKEKKISPPATLKLSQSSSSVLDKLSTTQISAPVITSKIDNKIKKPIKTELEKIGKIPDKKICDANSIDKKIIEKITTSNKIEEKYIENDVDDDDHHHHHQENKELNENENQQQHQQQQQQQENKKKLMIDEKIEENKIQQEENKINLEHQLSCKNVLMKFATVSNLNQCLLDVDADIEDIKSDIDSENEEEDSSYNSYSSDNNNNNKNNSENMKRKDKKNKHKKPKEEKQFNRNKIKLDHTKKCYVKDEAPPYPLIATPRPLWKPEKFIIPESDTDDSSDTDDNSDNDGDNNNGSDNNNNKKNGSDNDDSSTSDESSDDEFDDELNPNKSNIIRMSTCSNDSGFEGGTAPSSPKKMLGADARDSPSTPPSYNPAYKIESNNDEPDETSYTYAQFQKSGRITAPATNIPRFKKYSVEDFHFLTVLGKGSFGKVLLAELRNTDYYYAVKCLKKDVVLEDDDVECTLIERKVLALGTKHPYLCHLFCTFQTEMKCKPCPYMSAKLAMSHLFFVMEYLNGGDLMFHIQQSGRFPEPRARFYAAEIISGLKFLHKKGIIYRDLKLDNVLLDFDGHVRIADFGMCKLQIYLDKTADSFCGTPDYMAPEIIKGDNYNQSVDWWSFGVLLYEMLIGQSPFSGCDEEYLFWSICNEMPLYPLMLSQESTSLLKALLEKDSNKRIGSQYSPAGDIYSHPFFNQIEWDRLEKRQIEPPFKPQVKHPLDTQYFDKTFTRERVRLTPIDKDILQSMDQAQFQGFSYTNPNATLE